MCMILSLTLPLKGVTNILIYMEVLINVERYMYFTSYEKVPRYLVTMST